MLKRFRGIRFRDAGYGLIGLLMTPGWCGIAPAAHADALVQFDIPVYAASLVGTPYRWGGSAPGEGFDCSGLIAHVFAQVAGARLPRSSRELGEMGVAVGREALVPGDLVFFNTLDAPYSHVGIYLGDGRFVHAGSSQASIVLANLDETYWRERYDGARRIDLSDLGRAP